MGRKTRPSGLSKIPSFVEPSVQLTRERMPSTKRRFEGVEPQLGGGA